MSDKKPKVVLSIIIVSYNCLPFLRLCLDSLFWRVDSRMEVLVVDNNSTDETVNVLPTAYPQVKLIANKSNVGFGTACNQGINQASGDYYLMLNPDTVVDENMVNGVISFMQNYPNCGGMGAYMSDGKGAYLPESKRGLPTLFRSFCRFSGLTLLFPTSKWLAGYYMGHLSINEVHEVEVLSGAFMVLRSTAVEKSGAFDERFFMYGEDIDLSWRLIQAGFKNYYNPKISIIHFKGESTVKDSKYVKNFFGAMSLFCDIHFNSGLNRLLRPLVFAFTRIMSFIKRQQLKRSTVVVPNKIEDNSVVITHEVGNCFDQLGWKKSSPSDEIDYWNSVWLDMSTLKPSEAIEFVQNNEAKINQLIWLDQRREYWLKVSSSVEKTLVGNFNQLLK